jgi:D-apionolactonase
LTFQPSRELQHLSNGPLTAILDGPELAQIRLRGCEIVRRILVTVRDTNWDTVQPRVLSCSTSSEGDQLSVELEGEHVAPGISFQWRVAIRAKDAGLTYELDGYTDADFVYNRIGLCVLHPVATCAGATYRSSSADETHAGSISTNITPQTVVDGIPIPLFPPFDRLELDPATGGTISFGFEGDLFEMEDQRNWTDDSFKSYCTPASLGGPHRATRGQRFHQSVEVRATNSDITAEVLDVTEPIRIQVGGPSGGSVPALGLAMGSDLDIPDDENTSALRRLALPHIRADLKVVGHSLSSDLDAAIETQRRIDAPLELALHLELEDDPLLKELAQRLRDANVPLARVLAFHRDARAETPTETTSASLVSLVRLRLGDLAPVGGGTNMDFAELNRRRPDAGATQLVAWSINSQVHASDDASVMETLRGQPDTVHTARSFCEGCSFAVGPITLRQRFNPVATGPSAITDADAVPAHVDLRQRTQFCAAWTAGSIAGLAPTGVASLTYFELSGPAGVIDGTPFPVFHVFEVLKAVRGEPLLECRVTRNEEVAALATQDRLLVANLTARSQTALIGGLSWSDVRVWSLAEQRALASEQPQGADSLRLALEPYGVACLEPLVESA